MLNVAYLAMSVYLLNGGESFGGESRSTTCLLLLVVGVGIYFLLGRYREKPQKMRNEVIGFIAFTLITFITFSAIFDESLVSVIAESSGKDPTLTGRTDLWKDLISLGMREPMLGYGIGGFWSPERMNFLKTLHPWGPAQAHNGYIEIFLNLGVVGIVIFLLVVVSSVRRICIQAFENFKFAQFRAILLIIILVHNYSEAGFVRPTHLMWFAFLIITVNVKPYTKLTVNPIMATH